jgi:predicted Zn-dependent protease
VAKFVDAFFSKFDEFQKPPRHPKWREVNFAATLEGWHRSPASQAWIDRARQFAGNEVSKSTFDNFIAQNSPANSAPVSDEQRAELFKAFLEWNKTQH